VITSYLFSETPGGELKMERGTHRGCLGIQCPKYKSVLDFRKCVEYSMTLIL
jgi:hypothetical protein